jgi:hypothetical protein
MSNSNQVAVEAPVVEAAAPVVEQKETVVADVPAAVEAAQPEVSRSITLAAGALC